MGFDEAIINRFWSKVKKGAPDDCWEWQGGVSKNGRGCFCVKPKYYTAPRFAWMVDNGKWDLSIKDYVCHKCHNGLCCNPNHLYLGDHASNTRDMMAAGRCHRGSRTGSAKMREVDVMDARCLVGAGYSVREIAGLIGVTVTSMRKAIEGRTWGHVGGRVSSKG